MVGKKCSKCQVIGNPHGVDRRRKDGLTPWCKVCQKQYRVESTEKRLAKKKEYYEKNKARYLAKNKEWLLKNRDVANRYKRAYYKDLFRRHPELPRAYHSSRRTRESAAGGSYTAEQIRNLFSTQGGKCVYCKISLHAGYHADHVMPVVLGGGSDITNIQLLCKLCNQRKHAKHPAVFAKEMGLLV